MPVSLSPRSILITGASSGIGKALALYYAAPDVHLALGGRDEARLAAVAGQCRDKGATVHERVLCVTDRAAQDLWIRQADDKRPLDLVIANAGISGGTGGGYGDGDSGAGYHGEPSGQARAIFDVNVTRLINTVEAALPLMAARGYGQIALMSSLASFSGWPGAPSYSASKAAVRFYGEALRPFWARRNIQVNVICPGFIQTPMTAANNFNMPFMMSAPRAAEIIASGLAKNKGRIAFPLPTYALACLIAALPQAARTPLLARAPEKPGGTG